jgi:uncharacterized membrane protein
MLSVKLSLLLLRIYLMSTAASQPSQPFWKSPENYKKMTETRAILVSAKTDAKENLRTMSVAGAGIVGTPLNYAYAAVKKFEDLPKVSERFEEAKWDPLKEKLFLHMSAMGYHVKMTLKLSFIEKDNKKVINWESVEGGFVGMKGQITLIEQDARHTEMSMDAYYEAEKLPLPKVLMGIGLEFVTQRVAGTFREYIEKAYGRI